MNIKDPKVRAALRAALRTLTADRHTISYFKMNKLFVWMKIEQAKGPAYKRSALKRGTDGFKWAYYDKTDGSLIIGELDHSLVEAEYLKEFGGYFLTDIHLNRVKTILHTYGFPTNPEHLTGPNPAAAAAGVLAKQDQTA